MESSGINKANSSEINTQNSQISSKKIGDLEKTKKPTLQKNGATKPTIELDDFFAYLDPKVVEKIMQTPEESRARIVKDVHQYEFDINGAQNILDSLG
ncbi:MAG: hypothetical protein LUB59_04235 [Candidatus Gastranaerophilales bacterium]|nr:hypothetical protein [Candidatus Gastranaerophilales bacterium]